MNTVSAICLGDSLYLSASSGSPIVWSPAISNGTWVKPKASVEYKVSATDANRCTTSQKVSIVVSSPIRLRVTNESPTVCEGQILDLKTEGAPAYTITDEQGKTRIQPLVVNSAFFKVTGKNGACWQDTTIYTNIPTVDIGQKERNSCYGRSILLKATGSGDSYVWNDGFVNGQQIVPSKNTNYVVTSSRNGCPNRHDTLKINVGAAPILQIVGAPKCYGDSLAYSSTNSEYVHLHYDGRINDYLPLQDKMMMYPGVNKLYATNAYCSSDTARFEVFVPEFYPRLSRHTKLCIGDTLELNAQGNLDLYSWSGGITNGQKITPLKDATYTVTGSLKGCKARSDTIEIKVGPRPNLRIIGDAHCYRDSISFVCNNCDYTDYRSSDYYSTDSIIKDSMGSIHFTLPGSHYLYAANQYCQTEIHHFDIYQPVITSKSSDEYICKGTEVVLRAESNADTILWSNGATNGVKIAPSISTYYILIPQTKACIGPKDSIYVHVDERPQLIFPDNPKCPDYTFFLCKGCDSGSITREDGSFYYFSGSEGQVYLPKGKSIAYASNGACASDPQHFDLNYPSNIVTIPDTVLCIGDSLVLRAKGNADEFLWTENVVNGKVFFPKVSKTYTLTPLLKGCKGAESNVEVTVNPIPKMSIVAGDPKCAGDELTYACENCVKSRYVHKFYNSEIDLSMPENGIGVLKYSGDYNGYLFADNGACRSDSFAVIFDEVTARIQNFYRNPCYEEPEGLPVALSAEANDGEVLWNGYMHARDTIVYIKDTTTFVLQVKKGRCIKTDKLTVAAFPKPTGTVTPIKELYCIGDTINVNCPTCESITMRNNSHAGTTKLMHVITPDDSYSMYLSLEKDFCPSTLLSLPTTTGGFSVQSEICNNDSALYLEDGSPENGVFSGLGVIGRYFHPNKAPLGKNYIYYTTVDRTCVNKYKGEIEVNYCGLLEAKGSEYEMDNLALYPNPSNGHVNIASGKVIDMVEISSLEGTVLNSVVLEAESKLDLTNYAQGVYFLKMFCSDGIVYDKKIVIKK